MRHRIITNKADGSTVEVELNRVNAVRAKCTECLGFEDVAGSCTSPLCPWRGKSRLAWKRDTKEKGLVT